MKNVQVLTIILLAFIYSGCHGKSAAKEGAGGSQTSPVIVLTNEGFKQQVFNYQVNKEWKFEGKQPVIIDFYATWCGPCRMLSPKVEEIAREYAGKITVYKVDTDQEPVLAQALGISSLPTLLFIPMTGQPRASMGAVPKETLVKAIHEILLVK